MRGNPTLEDVARESGVSTATVSRALNEPAKVREQTRMRINEAVKRLGYTPHFGARALASNRTFTFGAVIPTMENAIFALGLQALQEELSRADDTLFVATSGYDEDREAEQIRSLIARGVDGLALIGEARSPEVYALMQSRGVPFVLIWTWRPDSPWRCVGFDNREAAMMMAEHVLGFGHRRLAMIAGVTKSNDRATARVEGVKAAAAGAGASLSLAEAPYQLDEARAVARRMISADPAPTVLICGNDVIAAGSIMAAKELGLSVPGDVSVVGFDDIEIARLTDPPLTTVRVPHRRMGAAAAQLLLTLRDNPEAAENAVFDAKIIERASLARPRR